MPTTPIRNLPGWRFALALTILEALIPVQARAESLLRFVAIGDTPYSPAEAQRLQQDIKAAITADRFPFVVHYGDFKAGNESCTTELFQVRRDDIYGLHPGRVFFTPGDNDWTDCDRAFLSSPVSELSQLDLMRRLFFGQPMQLPESWTYARQPNFPENARWMQSGVLFTTLHMVGTNNGRQNILLDDIEAALALVEARDQANRVWLRAAFQEAEAAQAQAIVIVTQADVTKPDGSGVCTAINRMNCDAFANFREQLIRHAARFEHQGVPKPVLLVHGDTHPYCLDQQFGGSAAPNLWRLNAWGDFQQPADATEITVQSQAEEPFTVRTLLGRQAPAEGCS